MSAEELGTAFTYQGQLKEGGVPANNWYDLRFRLFDAMTDGTQIGPTNEYEMLTINNGLFTVRLYFGADAYKGDARWLEIGIRSGDDTEPYTVLSPRQELTPAPYALALPAMRAQQSDISPNVIGGGTTTT